MKYKRRTLAGRLKQLLEQFAVVIISGARQVGKSTLVNRELPGWSAVVFDPVTDVGGARADADLFLQNNEPPLVLDEIQFAPELVPAIKRRVDREDRSGLYVLTGSQQWAVLKSAGESLAGRAAFLDLEGFSLREIAESVGDESWLERYLLDPQAMVADPSKRLVLRRGLYERLWRGFMPKADSLAEQLVSDFYRGYLRTYIERDVRLLADVADWQQFGRFVRLAAALTAQEINHSQLGREVGVTPQTARRWLAMLSATFQWFEVPGYHGSTVKRISSKPKGFFADTGLACNLQMISSHRALGGHPLTGALFETAVTAEIRKLAASMSTPPTIYHWRSHGGAEVDLLLERDGVFFPIEVKLGSNPGKSDTRGITALRRTYPKMKVAPGLVICPCEQVERLSAGDYALPWDSQ
jgi:predicted AAA+ superfamily ATPase